MSQPAYLRIRAELEQQIQNGGLPPGARLPTEAELQQQHSISRATAQRVLNELAHAGLVERHRRRGTFVTDAARQENLLRVVNPTLRGPEIPGKHRVESAAVITANDTEVELAGLASDAPVTQLRRVKLDVNDRPIAVECSAVPFAVAPALLKEHLEELAVHDYFTRERIPVAKTRVYLEPILLGKPDADRLAMSPGQPVMRLRRLTWLVDGGLAEAMWHLFRPDLVEFFLEQTVPSQSET